MFSKKYYLFLLFLNISIAIVGWILAYVLLPRIYFIPFIIIACFLVFVIFCFLKIRPEPGIIIGGRDFKLLYYICFFFMLALIGGFGPLYLIDLLEGFDNSYVTSILGFLGGIFVLHTIGLFFIAFGKILQKNET